MEPLNANDAQRYAGFKVWTPYEAALLLAGYKPLPRGHIPEPSGNTPAFNLLQAIQYCGPSKNLETPHPPETWKLWYSEYLAGRDFPDFSHLVIRDLGRNEAPKLEAKPLAPPPAGASGGVELDKAGPVDRNWVMKKAALIDKHAQRWLTAKRDFQDASENDLSKAAKAPGHGEWFEIAALNWARQRGKLTEEKQQGPASLATVWTGTKHTSED